MKIPWRKTDCWNSVVYSPDGKIALSLMIDGKQNNLMCDSIEDFISGQQAHEFDKSNKWVVAIPDEDCIFKEITLPAANLDEASKMLEYELRGLVPIDPKDLVYGCYEISHDSNSCSLRVCIIKKTILEKYHQGFRKLNIDPNRILVHSLAITETNRGQDHRKGLSDNECITDDLLDHPTEGREAIYTLVSEGAINICKSNKYANFNLISEQELAARARNKAVLSHVRDLAMVAILVIFVWINLCLANLRLARRIDSIDRQIDPIKDVAAQVEVKKIQLNAIKDQINSKGKIIRILDDFYGYTPQDVSLNELKIEHTQKGLRVQIKGQTVDHASAFGYTQALKKAVYIDGLNIGVGHMVPRPEGKSIVEFQAECLLSENRNAK